MAGPGWPARRRSPRRPSRPPSRAGWPAAPGPPPPSSQSRCMGRSVTSSPSSSSCPRRSPPTTRGASPPSTRHSVDLPDSVAPRSPVTAPSASSREISWRLSAARRDSGSSTPCRLSTAAPSRRAAGATATSTAATMAQRAARCTPLSAGAHSTVWRPGRVKPRISRASVRVSTSAMAPLTVGPATAVTPRSRCQRLPSLSSPRARCAAVTSAARSARRGIMATALWMTKVSRAGSAVRLEAGHQLRGSRGQVEERHRAGHDEDTDDDLGRHGDALAGHPDRPQLRPGPRSPPGVKRTLTMATLTASGSASRSEVRATPGRTRAQAAGSTTASRPRSSRAEHAAQHDDGQHRGHREDEPGQRVQAVPCRWIRRRPIPGGRGRSLVQWISPRRRARPEAAAMRYWPCGKRALVRTARAPRMT